MSSWTASVMIFFARRRRCLDSGRALQVAYPLLEQAAALEARNQPSPGVRLLAGQGAGVYARARDRMTHRGFSRDHDIVGDAEMAGDADHATDHAALADADAARDAGARGDRRVRTDAHVVSDHDQVV